MKTLVNQKVKLIPEKYVLFVVEQKINLLKCVKNVEINKIER